MARAGSGDLICVTGSLYVVGDLLNHWERLQSPRANRNPHLEK
jgi:folylpolyglutamate synthase/dihydropteroate synthase